MGGRGSLSGSICEVVNDVHPLHLAPFLRDETYFYETSHRLTLILSPQNKCQF